MKYALLKVAVGFLTIFCALAAMATGVPTIGGGVFGQDSNVAQWRAQNIASVSLQPGSVSLTVPGQIICPNQTVSGSLCSDNYYWMVYQIPGSSQPSLQRTITGLTGFVFNGTANGKSTDFGVLQCGGGVSSATALCTNMTANQITGLQLNAVPNGNGLTITMPNGVQGNAPLSIFVAITNANFNGIAPALLTTAVPPPQANQYALPHVVTGGGYVTKITIVNTSPQVANGQVNFISQAGALVIASPFTLNPGAMFRVQTNESDRYKPAVISWALVGSDQPIGINLFFELIPQNTPSFNVANSVGFNPAPSGASFTLPLELAPQPPGAVAGRTAGLAIANPNSSATNVTLTMYDVNGNQLAQTVINLPAFGQTSFDILSVPAFAAELVNADTLNSITLAATQSIAPVGLEDDFGQFSATPVFLGSAR